MSKISEFCDKKNITYDIRLSAIEKAYTYIYNNKKYININNTYTDIKDSKNNIPKALYEKIYHTGMCDIVLGRDDLYPFLKEILLDFSYESDKSFTNVDLITLKKIAIAASTEDIGQELSLMLMSILMKTYDNSEEIDKITSENSGAIDNNNYYKDWLSKIVPCPKTGNYFIPQIEVGHLEFHPYKEYENENIYSVLHGIMNKTYILKSKKTGIVANSLGNDIGYLVQYNQGMLDNDKVTEMLDNESDNIGENEYTSMKIDSHTGKTIEYDSMGRKIEVKHPKIRFHGWKNIQDDIQGCIAATVNSVAVTGNSSAFDNKTFQEIDKSKDNYRSSMSEWLTNTQLNNHALDRLATGG